MNSMNLMNPVIGVDLGATNIKIGLLKNDRILSRRVISTQGYQTQSRLISVLVCEIKEIIGNCKDSILAVGMGLPGPVDYEKGLVRYFPNIKGWRDVGLRDIIRRRTGLPVFIDNDANLMVLAEARIGAAKNKKNVVGITLGTGVGGGIIINGNLYRGASFVAGEVGHIPVNASGPKCNCGGKACLERYVGNRYILERAREFFGKDITLEKLSELADKRDVRAVHLWEDTATYVGIILTGIVNFLNPEAIVIGGGVAGAGEVLLNKIRQIIKNRAMPGARDCVKITKAKLGNDAGMLGAGILVKESLGVKELQRVEKI